VTLADRFNVTTEQLRRWNHLRSSSIRPGQTLFVAEPAHVSASARGKRGRRGKRSAGAAHAKPKPHHK
ncbi:MAG: LysM peptidoglycan-binding domain-containing protein, partial [Acidobacteriaceae bacterium]